MIAMAMAKKIPMKDCSKKRSALELGKKSINIFEPSKGGMGIKLNSPKKILTITIKLIISYANPPNEENLINIPKIMAIKKLEAGPAIATLVEPNFESLRL